MDRPIEDQLATARALRTAGDAAGATAAYRAAAAAAEAAGLPLLRAHALRHLGELLAEAGEGEAALTAAEAAVTLYRAAPASARLDLANALRVRAIALAALARAAEAAADWRTARGHYAALSIAEGVAECDTYLTRGEG